MIPKTTFAMKIYICPPIIFLRNHHGDEQWKLTWSPSLQIIFQMEWKRILDIPSPKRSGWIFFVQFPCERSRLNYSTSGVILDQFKIVVLKKKNTTTCYDHWWNWIENLQQSKFNCYHMSISKSYFSRWCISNFPCPSKIYTVCSILRFHCCSEQEVQKN